MHFAHVASRHLPMRTVHNETLFVDNWSFPVLTPEEYLRLHECSRYGKIPMHYPVCHAFSSSPAAYAQANLAIWFFCHPVMQNYRWSNGAWTFPSDEFLEMRLVTHDPQGNALSAPWVRVVNGTDDPLGDRFMQKFTLDGVTFTSKQYAYQALRLWHYCPDLTLQKCADKIRAVNQRDAGRMIAYVDSTIRQWNLPSSSWQPHARKAMKRVLWAAVMQDGVFALTLLNPTISSFEYRFLYSREPTGRPGDVDNFWGITSTTQGANGNVYGLLLNELRTDLLLIIEDLRKAAHTPNFKPRSPMWQTFSWLPTEWVHFLNMQSLWWKFFRPNATTFPLTPTCKKKAPTTQRRARLSRGCLSAVAQPLLEMPQQERRQQVPSATPTLDHLLEEITGPTHTLGVNIRVSHTLSRGALVANPRLDRGTGSAPETEPKRVQPTTSATVTPVSLSDLMAVTPTGNAIQQSQPSDTVVTMDVDIAGIDELTPSVVTSILEQPPPPPQQPPATATVTAATTEAISDIPAAESGETQTTPSLATPAPGAPPIPDAEPTPPAPTSENRDNALPVPSTANSSFGDFGTELTFGSPLTLTDQVTPEEDNILNTPPSDAL